MSLARFVAGWAGAHLLAMRASMLVVGLLNLSPAQRNVYAESHTLVFVGLLATLQFLRLRRSFGVSLRAWVPLAIIGAILGELAFQMFDALVVYPFPPKSVQRFLRAAARA